MSENPVGQSFSNVNASSTVTAVIAPASNTKGAIIRTASVLLENGGTTVWTGPTPPSSHTDSTKPVIFLATSGTSTEYRVYHFPYPLSLPAGYGVWVTSSSSVVGTSTFTYDLIG